MERLIRLVAIFALLVPAVRAQAQSDPLVRLKSVIEERAAKAGRPIDLEHERCTFVIAVNKSANIENGLPGQRIRQCIRGLLDSFWVDGESFRIIPFQLSVDPSETKGFTFQASNRIELYNEVDKLCSTSGDPAGGSDVEQAEDAVQKSMEQLPGNAVGVVFSNQDRSQFPIKPVPGWEGLWIDRRLATGVGWGKYLIVKDTTEKGQASTWAYVMVRPDSKQTQSLPAGRTVAVKTQNRDYPPARKGEGGNRTPPGDIRITRAQRPERFKVYLEWTRPRQAPTDYAVILRRKESPTPLATFPAKQERYTVSLPEKAGSYAITVVAVDAQGKPEGKEAVPVTVLVKDDGAGPDMPLILLLGGAALGLGTWLIWPVSVRVNESDRKRLWPWNPSFSVVTRGAATKGPGDLELDYTIADLDHPTLAEIKRRTFGGVAVQVGKGRLATVDGGRSSSKLPLSKGHHLVTILKESGERLADIEVQVGDSVADGAGAG
jgi:hypothetical protein